MGDEQGPSDAAKRTIEELRAELEAALRARHEPIALVGAACRFPGGVVDLASLWDLLDRGADAVTEVPKERWDVDAFYSPDPTARGKMNTRRGGFVADVDRFDARFFGIGPREATNLDPQQRLLLELAWEALEDAGVPPERLRGSATGVFVGMYADDYRELLASSPSGGDVYTVTGNMTSFAAGRISHLFDLKGPSVVVDTLSSASLVAVDLACQSLRSRRCDLALTGAASLILSPSSTALMSKLFALSPDGVSKVFDASANGYVRGEGACMLVLRRLSDALAAGDRILALLRGSAVNHDGHSASLTAPNVQSQRALLRAALADARVDPSEVGYVEAHGTGTPVGDPVEIDALKSVLGAPRPDGSVCFVGSTKGNLGHLEAVAGMAGLLKVVACFSAETIARQIHFERLNPRIDLGGTCLAIAARPQPWPRGGRRRIAGVSSFGLSGTNAHVVLEEPPVAPREAAAAPRVMLMPISARSEASLRAQAERMADAIANGPAEPSWLADAAYTASVRRSHHVERVAVTFESRTELAVALRAFARGEEDPRVARGRATNARRRVVFVTSGRGSEWIGMGRALREDDAFARALRACDEALRPWTGFSASDVLDDPGDAWSRADVIEPVLFAMQVALAAALRAWGVAPFAVLGDGVGEVAAAVVSGALSLEDGARVVAARSRLVGADGAPLAEDLRSEMVDALAGVQPRRAERVLFSTSAGAVVGDELDAGHWARSVRGPSRVIESVEELLVLGFDVFVEVGPHPLLAPTIARALGRRGEVVGSGRRGGDELRELAAAVARLHASGVEVDFARRWAGTGARPVRLPTYAWTRERYWALPGPSPADARPRAGDAWLGEVRSRSVAPGVDAWEGTLSPAVAEWLTAERVHDATIAHGALWLDAALHAARRAWGPGAHRAVDVRFLAPPLGPAPVVQIVTTAEGDGEATFDVASAPSPAGPWTAHAHGRLRHAERGAGPSRREPFDAASVEVAASSAGEPGRYEVDPRVLEACLGVLANAARDRHRGDHVLAGVDEVRVFASGAKRGRARAQRLRVERDEVLVDLALEDDSGGVLLEARGVRLARAGGKTIAPDPARRHEPFPLTDLQRACFGGDGASGRHVYLELEQVGLEAARLERAWRRVVERHDMLRAVVTPDGRQRVPAEAPPYAFRVRDLRHRAHADATRELEAVRARMTRRLFAAGEWPLFEISLSLLDGDRVRVHIGFDPQIADAAAIFVVLGHWGEHYRDSDLAVAPLALSFRDYVLGVEPEDARRRPAARAASLPPPPELPIARDPATLVVPRVVTRTATLDAARWARLKARVGGEAIAPSSAVLAAFVEVVAAWSASPRFTVDVTRFARRPIHPDVGALVGDFTSTTPLEVDDEAGTFVDRARALHARLLARGDAPASEPTSSDRVVFTSLLGHRDVSKADWLGELRATSTRTAHALLDAQIFERRGALVHVWDAVDEAFPEGLVDAMFTAFSGLVERLADEKEALRGPRTEPPPRDDGASGD